MKKLISCIKLLIFILIVSKSMAQTYEQWDTSSDELIYKEVATHKIVDKDLINLIVKYDKMYSRFIADSTLGITIFCKVSDATITYSVGYTVSIGGKSPILLCEPINGREVHITFLNIYRQVQLPYMRSVELLQNSYPKQYESHKISQREADKEGGISMMGVTSSFVWWEIVFDKYTGKCLKKITPDKTKEYKKTNPLYD